MQIGKIKIFHSFDPRNIQKWSKIFEAIHLLAIIKTCSIALLYLAHVYKLTLRTCSFLERDYKVGLWNSHSEYNPKKTVHQKRQVKVHEALLWPTALFHYTHVYMKSHEASFGMNCEWHYQKEKITNAHCVCWISIFIT